MVAILEEGGGAGRGWSGVRKRWLVGAATGVLLSGCGPGGSPEVLGGGAPERKSLRRGDEVYSVPKTARDSVLLSGPWKFAKSDTLVGAEAIGFDDAGWETVSLPHTWNTHEDRTVYRSSWYRTHIPVPDADRGKRFALRFEGVMTIAEVFLNGHRLGQHVGGYTAFAFDATPFVRVGQDNVLSVRVNNADNTHALPANNGLYIHWGGIYRKAWLQKTSAFHVDPLQFGSSGVYVTPTEICAERVELSIRTQLKNASDRPRELLVRHVLTDEQRRVALRLEGRKTVTPGSAQVTYSPNWDVVRPRDVVLVDDLDKSFTYSEGWSVYKNGNRIQGGCHLSKVPGSAAEYTFSGRESLTLFASRGPKQGRVEIFLDGVRQGKLDLYARDYMSKQEVFALPGLSADRHVLRLVHAGKNKLSTDGEVEIDACRHDAARTDSFGGTLRRSVNGQETVSLRFEGTGVSWVGARGPDQGIAEVFLDSTLVATVDLFAPARLSGVVGWSSGTLANGAHTLSIKNTGSRNKASTGTFVEVDAFRLRDAAGGELAIDDSNQQSLTVTGTLGSPRLWDTDQPNLYRVFTEIWVDGRLEDLVEERTGFRTVSATFDDFRLNGRSLPLRGASYHQETEAKASALSEEDFDRALLVMKEAGMNFVRLAHYPRAKHEYARADELGLVAWAENGNTGTSWLTVYDNFAWYNQNNLNRELVLQNYNHPSIAFWSAGNESESTNEATKSFVRALREEDPLRPIAYAANKKTDLVGYEVLAYNIYAGWYEGSYDAFPRNLRYVSESGAGGVITTHAPYRAIGWKADSFEPEEYQQIHLEQKLQYAYVTNPGDIPMFAWWNLFDFGDTKYKGMINSKGLFTYAGYPKDAYRLWQAFGRTDIPLIHVCGKHWVVRESENAVKAYANRKRLSLMVNGVPRGTLEDGAYRLPNGTPVNHVFLWEGVLFQGKNDIRVTDEQGHEDRAVVYFTGQAEPAPADPGALITGLASSNPDNPAVFVDRELQSQWPVYYQCDGQADNTFGELPRELAGARWIATKRQSDPARATTLTFRANPGLGRDLAVYVVFNRKDPAPQWLRDAGFEDTGISGQWRGNDLRRLGYRVFGKTASPGDTLTLGGTPLDFVVLLK